MVTVMFGDMTERKLRKELSKEDRDKVIVKHIKA